MKLDLTGGVWFSTGLEIPSPGWKTCVCEPPPRTSTPLLTLGITLRHLFKSAETDADDGKIKTPCAEYNFLQMMKPKMFLWRQCSWMICPRKMLRQKILNVKFIQMFKFQKLYKNCWNIPTIKTCFLKMSSLFRNVTFFYKIVPLIRPHSLRLKLTQTRNNIPDMIKSHFLPLYLFILVLNKSE